MVVYILKYLANSAMKMKFMSNQCMGEHVSDGKKSRTRYFYRFFLCHPKIIKFNFIFFKIWTIYIWNYIDVLAVILLTFLRDILFFNKKWAEFLQIESNFKNDTPDSTEEMQWLSLLTLHSMAYKSIVLRKKIKFAFFT